MTFLKTEIPTGLAFARIALNTRDRKKSSRNARNARTAYKTAMAYVARLQDEDPGVHEIREQVAALRQLLSSLGNEDSTENKVEPG